MHVCQKCVSPREDRGQLGLWPEIHATSRVFGTLGSRGVHGRSQEYVPTPFTTLE